MSFTLILSSEFVRYCPIELMQHTLTSSGIDVALVRIVTVLTFTFYYISLLGEILRPCEYLLYFFLSGLILLEDDQ